VSVRVFFWLLRELHKNAIKRVDKGKLCYCVLSEFLRNNRIFGARESEVSGVSG